MAIAETLKNYLDDQGIDYEIVAHSPTHFSAETAQVTHIPGAQLAKAVIVRDGENYLMVVLPSVHHVALGALHKRFQRQVGLATEADLPTLFPDCALGAIPAFGAAYGIQTFWDSNLAQAPEIYFEAGDHESVVHLRGEQFQRLMAQTESGHFSRHL
jgi:Ala-tRNA(Pro) deacylase